MDEIVIFSSGLNGLTTFSVQIKGKPTVLKKGNLSEISEYIFLNYPKVAKRFLSFKEYGIPFPKELSDLDSTPRAKLLELVLNQFQF